LVLYNAGMTNHTLGGDASLIAVAETMQPRREDFQAQCRNCGAFYCLRCDGLPEKCVCGKDDFSIIPVPCSELVKHVASKRDTWPRPIPVSERLPEEAEEVLVAIKFAADGFPDWGLASHFADGWQIWGQCVGAEDDDICIVTHWLPLPPAP
jgi:hypothetical protein